MEKIYIIEDDENIRNLLKIALEGFGYEAEGFETAEEGLERIRQEVAFRRSDLQQLYAELCREGILESGARCLQEAPPPEGLTREEQQCFRTCMSGLGRAEAQQECEQLDYYRARLQALQQTAEHAARRQAGLPRKLGLAAGMAMALLLI